MPTSRMKLIDLTGYTFGRLHVQSREANDAQGKPRWKCLCECGSVTVVASADLKKRGRGTKSCGCLARESASTRQRTHGMSRHPAYAVWRSLLARCLRKSHYAFHNYGGRGISVCAPWRESFDAFWQDMGPSYKPGLTLDRVNNDGDYEPGNCRWTDRQTQAMNTRSARLVSYKGEMMNVSEAARRSGVRANTVLYRIAAGWPAESLFIKANFSNRV